MDDRGREAGVSLRVLPGATDRRAAVRPALGRAGLTGCDPERFVLLGYEHERTGTAGAYPDVDEHGCLLLLPGEHRIGAWRAADAVAERRAPGGARMQARRRWRASSTPTVTLTDQRIVLHGPAAGDGAEVAYERLARARAVMGLVHGVVQLEVLLHCMETGTSANLTLLLVLRRRAARRLLHAVAAAHRARWARYDLPAPVAQALAGAAPTRTPRELRYDAVVQMPLGVSDAIRGPAAGPDVPQRLRASLRSDGQAVAVTSRRANAPASSS